MPRRRYRRAATVVVYWRRGAFLARNYLTRLETPVTAVALDLLEQLSGWTTVVEVARRNPSLGPPRDIARLLELFVRRGLVIRESKGTAEPSLEEWTAWHPEAAFFHFATKNGRFRTDPFSYDAELAQKAKTMPTPAPTKSIEGPALALPKAIAVGGLSDALTARRTWRRFGTRALRLAELATLLQWTFGVQSRLGVPGQGDIVLKTSPSGGARHPIEAYVVAFGVEGVPVGSVHHYDAEGHRLVRLPGRVARTKVTAELGHQPYFARAAALVLMAPVFARTMWRYPSSRAYRSVLIEAGHLCQTFCLVATAMELAPFSTIGFGERAWERALGLDGISETPIYIAGVGARPGDGRRAGALPPRWARKVKAP